MLGLLEGKTVTRCPPLSICESAPSLCPVPAKGQNLRIYTAGGGMEHSYFTEYLTCSDTFLPCISQEPASYFPF